MIVQLSDSTPQHRDNFLKLVNEQFYDSLLFHRVIREFMVQAATHKARVRMPTRASEAVAQVTLWKLRFVPTCCTSREPFRRRARATT